MKKITYTCDRCGKEITGGVLQIFPQYIEPGSGDYEEKQPYEAQLGRHYCEECAKLVMDLLESGETKAFFQGVGDKTEEKAPKEDDPGLLEKDQKEDPVPQGKATARIKSRNLPPVREYRGGRKGIDKNKVYADYLEMKGQKNLYKTLAAKYGCSSGRVSQIVKEFGSGSDPLDKRTGE